MEFDINQSLKLYLNDPASLPTPDAAQEITDTDGDSPDQATLTDTLEPIRDSIRESPDALMRSSSWDTLQCILKCV